MINGCNCCIQIQDETRKKRWDGIFDDNWIPVAGPARGFAEFDGEKSQPYYCLAVYKLTPSQKLLIAQRTEEHFGIKLEDILNDFEKPNMIFPILFDDTIQVICAMHTRMMIS